MLMRADRSDRLLALAQHGTSVHTMTHDPLLGSVTAYTMDVECMSYCYGGSPRLEVDEWPDDNCVVKWADLPDLIAKVREGERGKTEDALRDYASAHYASKERQYGNGYAAALRDALTAVNYWPDAANAIELLMEEGR